MIKLQQLLKSCVQEEASDLHLVEGSSPALRVNGKLVRIKTPSLSGQDIKNLAYSILTDYQKSVFEKNKELDFAFSIKKVSRFRANYFFQKGAISCAFRRIPLSIPIFSELALPIVIANVINFPQGLVLVCGPTGSGKTTTIASLLNEINKTRKSHIITVEDPIEYIYKHEKCIVNQREVGLDTKDFQIAAKQLLRQDPDVCLIGELRDRSSVEFALRLAETGHLVFATLHTNSAAEAIQRLINMFHGDERDHVKIMLSQSLNAVISQRLVPGLKGGLVAACEYLQVNTAIKNMIREDKAHQIYGAMQMGRDKSGMMTMNNSLMSLILKRKVDIKDAFMFSPDPEELDKALQKAGI